MCTSELENWWLKFKNMRYVCICRFCILLSYMHISKADSKYILSIHHYYISDESKVYLKHTSTNIFLNYFSDTFIKLQTWIIELMRVPYFYYHICSLNVTLLPMYFQLFEKGLGLFQYRSIYFGYTKLVSLTSLAPI